MSIAADDWALGLRSLLPKAAFQVLRERAQRAGSGHLSWQSQPDIARRTGNSLRTVKRADAWLVDHGALVPDGWQWTKNSALERGGVLTRRYRLPVGEPLERLVAARPIDNFRSATVAPLNRDRPDFRSAKVARLNGVPPDGLEVPKAPFRSATVTLNHSNTKNPDDGAGEGAPLTPAPAPPKAGATPVQFVAARGAGMTETLAGVVLELTPAQEAATVDRQQRALRLLSAVKGKAAAPVAGKGGNWWDVQPAELVTARNRPNRLAGDRKDWRRGRA